MNELQQAQGQALAPALPALIGKYLEWLDRAPITSKAYLSHLRQFGGWMRYKGITTPERRDIISYRDWLTSEHPAIIYDVLEGWLPSGSQTDNVLLIYTHNTARFGQYSVKTNPYLLRLSAGADGTAKVDTLVTYPESTVSSSAEQMNDVLTYVKDNFPAKSYGMTFASHASGYLPAGFYGMSDR
jgi:hypothetical protein